MSQFGILLSEAGEGWEIRCLSPHASTERVVGHEPIEIATRTVAFAKKHALDIGKIVIAVASESVLFASLPNEVASDILSNQSLRFALESVLPVDAESIVADTIQVSGKGAANELAAVCIEVAHLKPIVNALEQLRGRVQFIVPSAILALEQALADKILIAPSISIWSLDQNVESQQVEIMALGMDKSLSDWRISRVADGILNHHLLQLNSSDMPIFLCGSKDQLQEMANTVRQDIRSIEIDRSELIRKRGSLILTGRAVPCLDLRRDELTMLDPFRRDRKSLVRLALAITLFVATLCGTLLWQASHFQSTTEQYKSKQQDIFRAAFPKQRLPAAILGRLKSEHTKAKGIRKTDPKTASPQSALTTLHQIIDSLTDEFPFEIQDIRVENGRFTLEIELLSQQDTGRIVAAIALRGFDVEPPSTTLVNGDRILARINAIAAASASTPSSEWDEKSIR